MAAAMPSVRDVLLDRLVEGSRPGARTDGHKVVLAVEGGGMRGAVSAGMLLALEQLGLRDSFDEVFEWAALKAAQCDFCDGRDVEIHGFSARTPNKV